MRRAAIFTLAALDAACRSVEAQEPPERARDAATPLAPPPAATPAEAAADASAVDAGALAMPLTSRKFVLHVGDSTVGYTLGLTLELGRMFKTAGVRYESRTVTAAGLHAFATSKVLADLVRERDPDLVIVQLGTNNLTVPHPEVYIADVKSIVAQAGGRACFWIGPIPLDRPEHGMRAVIRDNAAPCVFYDSFDLKLARQEDGIHPTQGAAKKWAEAFWAFGTKR